MAAPSSFNDLITQINAMLQNFSIAVGEDVVSSNTTGATDFTKATGTYINTPDSPWTSGTIPISSSLAVRGGISSVWYKGPVLTKASFTGGTVTMFSGTNVLNELCRVFIDYDAGSGAFSVNIQTGFTGDLPTGIPCPDAPISLTLTEGTFAIDVPDAPTALTLTEGTV